MRLLALILSLFALPVTAHDSETPFLFINEVAVEESPITFSSVADWELAEHTAEPVRIGQEVTFRIDPSYFTETEVGTITTATWSFGDDTSSEGLSVPHTYSKAGRYLITVRSGEQILSDSWLQVLADGSELPPVPEIKVNGTLALNGAAEASFRKPVTLQVTNLPDGATVSWDLGNTKRAEGMRVRAEYDPLMSTAYPIARITHNDAVREVQLILEYPGAGTPGTAQTPTPWVAIAAGALLLIGALLAWYSRHPLRY